MQQVPGTVGLRLEFRRGVALDGQAQIVAIHAAAVILDDDARQPAQFGADVDLGGAGVDGVLDQFLDRRGRALDDLAGGDAVDGVLGEALDNRHPSRLPGVARSVTSRLENPAPAEWVI